MKQFKLTFLFVLLISTFPTRTSAHDIEVPNAEGVMIYYVWTNGHTELAVSFKGESYNSSSDYTGNIIIPESVDYEGNTYSVTSIDQHAFDNCSGLTSVTIPNSVTRIKYEAFRKCTGLTSIIIPQNVTRIDQSVFYGCSNLASVSVLNSETSIGSSAFKYTAWEENQPDGVIYVGKVLYEYKGVIPENTSITIKAGTVEISENAFRSSYVNGLSSITIPNSVKTIGAAAFYQCTKLISIDIPSSVTSIGGNAFLYTAWYDNLPDGLVYAGKVAYKYKGSMPNNTNITIQEGTTEISDNAFLNCTGLNSIVIPNSVTKIGNSAFSVCSDLTSVTIGNSVTSIDNNAFFDCSSLTSVTIPNSVTSIGGSAFARCSGLSSVTIGNSVTSIGDNALYQCTGLTFIVVESGNTVYDSRNNCNAIIETSTNTLITGCKNTTIPNSVTSIGQSAFQGCSSLTSVTIPNSVTSIDQSAFSGCSGLTSVTIGNSVTSIGSSAFYGCSRLTSVEIPNSVTRIGGGAFNQCSGLKKVIVGDIAAWCNISFGNIYDNPLNYAHHLYSDANTEITDLVIPNSVTSIGNYAFYQCSGLTSVTIPNTVTSIGYQAFSGCTNLTSISIPNSVTSIGYGAFRSCYGLTSVTVKNETPVEIEQETFSSRAIATLYVPYGCKAAYEAADYWKEFKEIVEMPAPSNNISFADSNVKAICVANWDTNGDGELSEAEAASVTSLGNVFKNNRQITSFNELQYFTGLTSIGGSAFYYCNNLTSVEIPCNVTGIGNYAFYFCESLTSVTISNGLTNIADGAFSNCSGLTFVEFPNSVTSIGNNAFFFCTSLTSVEIPNSVTTIGNYAFQGCNGLTSVEIPNSVTSIGEGVFNGCTGLTSVEIPNTVTSIGNYAFSYSGLTSVEIPNSVTSIGISAFSLCSSLTSVTIPNSVTSIGSDAFYSCSGLTSVTIGNGVTSIDGNPFSGCSDLTSITVSSGNSKYNSRNNCNAIIETASKTLISGCKNTVIPNGVTIIGNSAFQYCTGLTSVTIPNSVTNIGAAAFAGCSSLTEVTVEIETPLTIPWGAFSNRANATLYVPAGCKAAYEAAQYWQDFKEIIEMASGVTVGDLNGDGIVSITDVVLIIDVMAGLITDANQVAAADVNGDGDVTITDCVAAIDLIAAQQGNSPLMAMAPSMQPSSDYISGNYQDGQLTVDLCNENRYTAFQMAVSVPAGMRIVKAKMNRERGEEHQVLVRSIGSGQYLVAGFSLDNEELAGNNGSLLTIMTEGECQGDIVVSDVEFATVEAEAWHLAGITINGSTTGIANMETDAEQTVYDLQGRKLDSQILRSQRIQGSNLIVIVNGKKVVIK